MWKVARKRISCTSLNFNVFARPFVPFTYARKHCAKWEIHLNTTDIVSRFRKKNKQTNKQTSHICYISVWSFSPRPNQQWDMNPGVRLLDKPSGPAVNRDVPILPEISHSRGIPTNLKKTWLRLFIKHLYRLLGICFLYLHVASVPTALWAGPA